MRVCYFGTYEADYDRNRMLLRGLRTLGADVIEVHEALFADETHKTGNLKSPRALAGLAFTLAKRYGGLIRRYLRAPEHDVMVVGYLGHLDMLVAAPLARRRGKKVVFDAFISLYDTLVNDRKMFRAGSPPALAAKALDRLACALADRVLLDTEAHARYFVEELGVEGSKCRVVPVGADEDFYQIGRAHV